MSEFKPIKTVQLTPAAGEDARSRLFDRDPATLARPWVTPGTPGLMYRIGGLEKDIKTGNISYDADNHQAMTQLRADKVERVRDFIPDQSVEIGPDRGRIAMVGWGSTYGAIFQAVRHLRRSEPAVSHIHLRYLSPLPRNLGELLSRFDHVIVPEMNNGQLATLLRDKLGIELIQHNKVSGQPFQVRELVAFAKKVLTGNQVRKVVQMVQGERS
jgi:2-oxoglutarate ferredoxin oxidoreductase subunit alpha